MLSVNGDTDAAVTARIHSGWFNPHKKSHTVPLAYYRKIRLFS